MVAMTLQHTGLIGNAWERDGCNALQHTGLVMDVQGTARSWHALGMLSARSRHALGMVKA